MKNDLISLEDLVYEVAQSQGKDYYKEMPRAEVYAAIFDHLVSVELRNS